MTTRAILMLGAAAGLAACSFEPHYVRPAAPVPVSWPQGDAYLTQSEAALPSVDYRQVFTDPRLQQIIAQALRNNRDLRVAVADIAQARAAYRIQRADLFPQIDATGQASFRGGGARSVGTGTGGASGSSASHVYTADVGTSAFEIDLFGRVRSLNHAALDRYFATEAGARATRLSLVSEIASAWLTYAADKSLLKIAEDTVASAQKSVDLTRARLEGGIAPRTDLRQAQTVLDTAQSDAAQQRTFLAQDVNALQLLVGAPIDAALLPESIEQVVPTLHEIPAGLDSSILLRRPDVVEAEYQLRAANAQIGAARAALFPRISLTGLAGFASTALGSLFTGDAFTWSVSPSVSYPIFRAGAGRATVAQSKAARDAAVATYEKAIQSAFRDVADALARRGTIDAQVTADRNNVAHSLDNYRLSDARYRGGIDTFLSSLDAQRTLYGAQRNYVSTELAKATNLVDLYTALGGDATLDATANGPKPSAPEPEGSPIPNP
ncbi:MAG TPA: efflux transporter outer membrane subunit [Sphingomonas sp.]|nr:efflux transporter outer membrane subunit [Sphingomonas sp.]